MGELAKALGRFEEAEITVVEIGSFVDSDTLSLEAIGTYLAIGAITSGGVIYYEYMIIKNLAIIEDRNFNGKLTIKLSDSTLLFRCSISDKAAIYMLFKIA